MIIKTKHIKNMQDKWSGGGKWENCQVGTKGGIFPGGTNGVKMCTEVAFPVLPHRYSSSLTKGFYLSLFRHVSLTCEQYPTLVRGSYGVISDADIHFFRSILGQGNRTCTNLWTLSSIFRFITELTRIQSSKWWNGLSRHLVSKK